MSHRVNLGAAVLLACSVALSFMLDVEAAATCLAGAVVAQAFTDQGRR